MGELNDTIFENKISFSKIEELLRILLKKPKNKSQNIITLHEIGLLKEYSYIISDKSSKELISFSKNQKMIKKFETSSILKENFVEWTKFLFDINKNDLESEQHYNQKIENLKQKPLNKSFFQNNIKKYMFKSEDFKKLINYGIPNNFREFIWELAISEKFSNNKCYNFEKEQKIYNFYLRNDTKNRQIEKDLNRTFINVNEQTTKNIQILRNVLNCINKYNNGYVQGMNFIVGFLLKLTNFDEVQTFYIFINILNDIKGYFEEGFPLLRKNLNKFELLFQYLYPKLYKHFKKNEIYNEMWISKWFQTLFTVSLPFQELCTVWDNLLINGFDFIIYISLSIIGSIEDNLLELKDSSDILEYLQKTLNPAETTTTNKKIFEEEKKFIIALNEIISEAYKIEKTIKNSNINIFPISPIVNKNSNKAKLSLKKSKTKNDNHNDFDSICTRETDNSIKKKNSITSQSSSLSSFIIGQLNSSQSSDLTYTQSNISNINTLKNNLSNAKFGQNNIYNNNTFKKIETFTHYKAKTLNPNMASKGNIKNVVFNPNLNNLRNSNGINFPLQNSQCIYYPNNMNYNIVNRRPLYSNFLIYYA